jgi:hypothetical protein
VVKATKPRAGQKSHFLPGYGPPRQGTAVTRPKNSSDGAKRQVVKAAKLRAGQKSPFLPGYDPPRQSPTATQKKKAPPQGVLKIRLEASLTENYAAGEVKAAWLLRPGMKPGGDIHKKFIIFIMLRYFAFWHADCFSTRRTPAPAPGKAAPPYHVSSQATES